MMTPRTLSKLPLRRRYGSEPILVFPLLPRPNPVAPGSPSVEPVGDYGDAPDGQFAYAGVTGEDRGAQAMRRASRGRAGLFCSLARQG